MNGIHSQHECVPSLQALLYQQRLTMHATQARSMCRPLRQGTEGESIVSKDAGLMLIHGQHGAPGDRRSHGRGLDRTVLQAASASFPRRASHTWCMQCDTSQCCASAWQERRQETRDNCDACSWHTDRTCVIDAAPACHAHYGSMRARSGTSIPVQRAR